MLCAKTNLNKYINGLTSICLLSILILFAIKCISIAMTSSFSYDGGIVVQVAQNLVKNLRYETSYVGGPIGFNASIGIPVLLPVAVLFKLFGESFACGLIINAIYMILLVSAIVYYLKYCVNLKIIFVILAIIMFLGNPKIFEWGFGLYGEMPTLFYLLLALIFVHKHEKTSKSKYIFLAGVILGFGYLTKSIILISVPAFIFMTVFDYLFKRRLPIKSYIQQYLMMPLGFVIPVFMFETYKLISSGFAGYYQLWAPHILEILKQTGIERGYADTNGFFAKFIKHLGLLSSYVKVDKTIILFLLLVLLISFTSILLYSIYTLWKKLKFVNGEMVLFSNDFLVLITVTLSYFGWWLIITPTQKAYYRRIIISDILLEICIVIIVYLVYVFSKKLVEKSKKTTHKLFHISMIIIFLMLLSTSIFGIIKTQNYSISFIDTPMKTSILEAGEFINSLPPAAEFFGFGDWQAPNVEFASGKIFKDINNTPGIDDLGPKKEKYLVVDNYAYYMDAKGYKAILSKYENQLIFSNQHNLIYKLIFRNLLAYPKFSDEEKRQVSYNKIDFKAIDNANIYLRNVYINENNNSGKWAQKLSGYLFKYNGEKTLRIQLWFPDLEKYDKQPFELDVFVNNVLMTGYEVSHDGSQKMNIPLKNVAGSTIEVTLISDAKILSAIDPRELSVFLISMELIK